MRNIYDDPLFRELDEQLTYDQRLLLREVVYKAVSFGIFAHRDEEETKDEPKLS